MKIKPERLQATIQTVLDRVDPAPIILFEARAGGEMTAEQQHPTAGGEEQVSRRERDTARTLAVRHLKSNHWQG